LGDPATRKQAVPHLTGTAKTAFLQATRDPNWSLTLLFNCHRRALLGASNSQPEVSPHEALKTISAAAAALDCYCGVYTQYLVRLLIDGELPDENDSGDIELFPNAIDDDHLVVTSERKWKRNGGANWIRQPSQVARATVASCEPRHDECLDFSLERGNDGFPRTTHNSLPR
jgi:hypothetical protein